MINKIYEKIKKYIKENYKFLITVIIVYTILLFPVNYYITTGGGVINTQDRIVIENQYNSKGKLSLAYVSQIKANVSTYLLSYLFNDWEREKIDEYKLDDKESIKDIEFRNKIELETSISDATFIAYQKAQEKIEVKNTKLYVLYVYDLNKDIFKVGDQILKADNISIKNKDQLKEIINSHNYNDKIKIEIKRNKNILTYYPIIKNLENTKAIGIYIGEETKYKTNKKITLKFNKSESGPSGGLMLALDIYNKLTKNDITKGKSIVGTGTIDSSGNVGEISGIKYKLMGAVDSKADIFIAPSGNNYKEALEYKNKNNLKIKIIEAKTFNKVLQKLKEM